MEGRIAILMDQSLLRGHLYIAESYSRLLSVRWRTLVEFLALADAFFTLTLLVCLHMQYIPSATQPLRNESCLVPYLIKANAWPNWTAWDILSVDLFHSSHMHRVCYLIPIFWNATYGLQQLLPLSPSGLFNNEEVNRMHQDQLESQLQEQNSASVPKRDLFEAIFQTATNGQLPTPGPGPGTAVVLFYPGNQI